MNTHLFGSSRYLLIAIVMSLACSLYAEAQPLTPAPVSTTQAAAAANQPAKTTAPAASTTSAAAAASTQSPAQVTQLGTVTVTSARRSQPLQTVPMPVSVITNQEIQRLQLQDFADYVDTIPGLNYVSIQPGLTTLSIRGISSGSAQPAASVGIYIDNTPFGSSSVFAVGSELTPDLDPSDLERIEVLRGPQGTLYGAGALSGVIRFITIPPDTENYAGRVELDGTSVHGGGDGFGLHVMANVPLVTDKLAVRVTGYDRTDPGFIDDAGLGQSNVNKDEVKGGRAEMLWTPTDKTSLNVSALAQNLIDDGSPTEALDPTTLQPLYGDLQQRAAAGTGTFNGQYRLYNATFNTDFDWAKLMASSSYSTLDAVTNADVTPLLYLGPQANGQPYGTLEQLTIPQTKSTQEIRLTSPESQFVSWLAGVFTTHETGNNMQHIYASDYDTGTPLPSPFGVPIGDDNQPSTYDEYAAYGSLTWHFTNQFSVETGARYSHDHQHYTEIGNGLLFGLPTAPPTVLLDTASSDSTTTYSLTPKYQINATNMVYARVASGFIPGGPNIVTPGIPNVPATFSPTKLTNYEVGYKSTFLDDRLLFDLSAYYIDWTSIPLTTFVSPYTFLSSGGQAKSKGLEATIGYIPVEGLKFSLNTSYIDPTLTVAPPGTNGAVGERLPYIPKWNISLNGDYDFPLGATWRGFVGASYLYVGERETDLTVGTAPRSTVPSYTTLDLRAGAGYGLWTFT
ncbi:MAG: TonB-dependent receptor, partial [Gammaproteobacteria bacterium]